MSDIVLKLLAKNAEDRYQTAHGLLADIPAELMQELDETTLVLNQEAILGVVDRIAAHEPDTAEHLPTLVQHFQIERIRELLEDKQ